MVYSQDPGAMSALSSLPDLSGARVLDTCAAPGGKSAQLAAAIGEKGVLVSNEYVPSRCKLLVGNIERLGIPNALVLNGDTARLRDSFPAYFDLVLVDAPCSGEGMFRKSEDAREMWSEENVRACAARQTSILDDAAATVRGGGYLLYSTCTFSLEENEGQVAAFLSRHPDFSLCDFPSAVHPYTVAGVPVDGAPTEKTRRFYPHVSPGEGQFMALMRRGEGDVARIPTYRDAAEMPTRQDKAVLAEFFRTAWGDAAVAERDDIRLRAVKSAHQKLVGFENGIRSGNGKHGVPNLAITHFHRLVTWPAKRRKRLGVKNAACYREHRIAAVAERKNGIDIALHERNLAALLHEKARCAHA
jgi:hypothetical protein